MLSGVGGVGTETQRVTAGVCSGYGVIRKLGILTRSMVKTASKLENFQIRCSIANNYYRLVTD